MTKLIDPRKLVSFPQVAAEHGYNPDYLRQVAVAGKLEAWLVGHTWVTTRENVKRFAKSARPVGKPPSKSGPRRPRKK